MKYRVIQTDCRTAWLVIDMAGRVVPFSMRRNWKAARELAAELNEKEAA